MRYTNKPQILMFFFSFIGLLTAIFLIEQHYHPSLGGSGIIQKSLFSSTLINTSIHSELMGVSLALLAVFWFTIIGFFTWLAFSKPEKHAAGLFTCNLLSLPIVAYFIWIEYLLKTIGPYVSFMHLLLVGNAICSLILLKRYHFTFSSLIKQAFLPLFLFMVLSSVTIGVFHLQKEEPPTYDAFAQCITEKGIVMYASQQCITCQRNKALFGESFQYIQERECHPDAPNSEREKCDELGVYITPTWVRHEEGVAVEAHSGFLSIRDLSLFSGCTI